MKPLEVVLPAATSTMMHHVLRLLIFSSLALAGDAFASRRNINLQHNRHQFLFRGVPTFRSSSEIALNGYENKTPHRSPLTQLNALSPKINVALISSSIAILSGYHLKLLQKELYSDTKTWRQYQADTREDWSKHVRETEGWLYAIQSLRNAISAQTFLASTVLSLLTLITGRLWDILRGLTDRWERRLLTVQLGSISMTMLFSAYQFLQGTRLMTHAGFMFPVKDDTSVDKIMRKTQNCQWLGLRSMYVALAPISWVVGGSRAFFGVSCLLVFFFREIDKQPTGTCDNNADLAKYINII